MLGKACPARLPVGITRRPSSYLSINSRHLGWSVTVAGIFPSFGYPYYIDTNSSNYHLTGSHIVARAGHNRQSEIPWLCPPSYSFPTLYQFAKGRLDLPTISRHVLTKINRFCITRTTYKTSYFLGIRTAGAGVVLTKTGPSSGLGTGNVLPAVDHSSDTTRVLIVYQNTLCADGNRLICVSRQQSPCKANVTD